ncbi:MAG: DHHW family protein [Eubacteriales bacterium]|nr:DHHW family protein [Eubacteriales bacterium]
MTKRQNSVVIAGFLAMIFSAAGISLLKPSTDFSEKENRVLAQHPGVTLEGVLDGSFSKDYETYLADQFFARNAWIGFKTMTERSLGKQEINDIYFAKDGYLIEKHSGAFATDTAERNIGYLTEFVEAQQVVCKPDRVKVMIVPNAVEILKDKLPPYAENTEEAKYLDRIADALPPDSMIDVQEVLSEHKEEEIYYRTDHHWKTLGARYAYEAWAEEIGLDIMPTEDYEIETLTTEFFGTIEAKVNCRVQSDSIERYRPKQEVPYTLTYNHHETREDLYDLSYLESRDKYAVFFGGNQPLIEARTASANDRRLVVIKDSYANCFLPFAIQDFEKIDIIDIRYFNESLKEYLANEDYTDVLVLYNASGFAGDTALARLEH